MSQISVKTTQLVPGDVITAQRTPLGRDTNFGGLILAIQEHSESFTLTLLNRMGRIIRWSHVSKRVCVGLDATVQHQWYDKT